MFLVRAGFMFVSLYCSDKKIPAKWRWIWISEGQAANILWWRFRGNYILFIMHLFCLLDSYERNLTSDILPFSGKSRRPGRPWMQKSANWILLLTRYLLVWEVAIILLLCLLKLILRWKLQCEIRFCLFIIICETM